MSEPFQFEINEHVIKFTGDYAAPGAVVGRFHIFPESGEYARYVVRHKAEGGGFFCHIYNGNQLQSRDRVVAHAKQNTKASSLHASSSAQSEVRQEGGDQAVGGEGVLGRGQSIQELQKGQHEETLTQRELGRQMGYTGDVCLICAMFTMKRNGPCLVCETCGATTGCS